MSNPMHGANMRRWDVGAEHWAESADARGLWRRCPSNPELVLSDRELAHLSDVAGKRVAVLGSGDNQVVFALCGLGASVTSVDISEKQLGVARDRAADLGLPVTFVRADVTDLSTIPDHVYDAVYTGGHVAVWVSDVQRFYSEAVRILKPGGLLVVSEYHPFRRIWKRDAERLSIEYPYFARGPFEYESADVLHPEAGQLKTYEFHWTVADYVNAVLRAGCSLRELGEFGEEVADWEGAPLHGLPESFLIVAEKSRRSSAAIPQRAMG